MDGRAAGQDLGRRAAGRTGRTQGAARRAGSLRLTLPAMRPWGDRLAAASFHAGWLALWLMAGGLGLACIVQELVGRARAGMPEPPGAWAAVSVVWGAWLGWGVLVAVRVGRILRDRIVVTLTESGAHVRDPRLDRVLRRRGPLSFDLAYGDDGACEVRLTDDDGDRRGGLVLARTDDYLEAEARLAELRRRFGAAPTAEAPAEAAVA